LTRRVPGSAARPAITAFALPSQKPVRKPTAVSTATTLRDARARIWRGGRAEADTGTGNSEIANARQQIKIVSERLTFLPPLGA
jgi:hypothetical protein